jgi:hypothetical protein
VTNGDDEFPSSWGYRIEIFERVTSRFFEKATKYQTAQCYTPEYSTTPALVNFIEIQHGNFRDEMFRLMTYVGRRVKQAARPAAQTYFECHGSCCVCGADVTLSAPKFHFYFSTLQLSNDSCSAFRQQSCSVNRSVVVTLWATKFRVQKIHILPTHCILTYRVIRKSLRDFRPLRYSSRDEHAEGEHVNRGRDTPSFCPTLQVLDMSTPLVTRQVSIL